MEMTGTPLDELIDVAGDEAMEIAEELLAEAVEDIEGHLEQMPRLDDYEEVLEEIAYLQETEDYVSVAQLRDAVRIGVILHVQRMEDDSEE